MNKLALIMSLTALTSCCTLTLTNIDTRGNASDVVDHNQEGEALLDLKAEVPLSEDA